MIITCVLLGMICIKENLLDKQLLLKWDTQMNISWGEENNDMFRRRENTEASLSLSFAGVRWEKINEIRLPLSLINSAKILMDYETEIRQLARALKNT